MLHPVAFCCIFGRYCQVRWVSLTGSLRQAGGRIAHVQLAGHHVGDEARAVLAEELDLAAGAGDGGVDAGGGLGRGARRWRSVQGGWDKYFEFEWSGVSVLPVMPHFARIEFSRCIMEVERYAARRRLGNKWLRLGRMMQTCWLTLPSMKSSGTEHTRPIDAPVMFSNTSPGLTWELESSP